jgi:putative hydrolase
MKILCDYHTHTVYSHGKGTIKENAEAALEKGLKEVAICDHGPNHVGYGVKRENLFKMRNEIDELNLEYEKKGLKILLGVEANIVGYDGTIDVDREVMKILDILLVGYHFGAFPKSFKNIYNFYIRNFLAKIFPSLRDKAKKANTIAFIKAMEKYPIDVITHPGSKVDVDVRLLAREAAKKGTALEINSSHSQLSVEYLKIALKEDVDFIINSDAHTPEDVGNFNDGIIRALDANVPVKRIRNAVY